MMHALRVPSQAGVHVRMLEPLCHPLQSVTGIARTYVYAHTDGLL